MRIPHVGWQRGFYTYLYGIKFAILEIVAEPMQLGVPFG
jgi:hypothetical protein